MKKKVKFVAAIANYSSKDVTRLRLEIPKASHQDVKDLIGKPCKITIETI